LRLQLPRYNEPIAKQSWVQSDFPYQLLSRRKTRQQRQLASILARQSPTVGSVVSTHFDDPILLAYASEVNYQRWVVVWRREVGFESLQAPGKISGDHDRRADASAARSNSETRASVSSISSAFAEWLNTLSAARTLVEAGGLGSTMTFRSVETGPPE
jgi:hypothetical protein